RSNCFPSFVSAMRQASNLQYPFPCRPRPGQGEVLLNEDVKHKFVATGRLVVRLEFEADPVRLPSNRFGDDCLWPRFTSRRVLWVNHNGCGRLAIDSLVAQ